jgi:hypothetical protein
MTQRHWTNDELLDHLYGLGPEDGHEKECAECQQRIVAMQSRRAGRADEPWVPEEFLRTQRESITRQLAVVEGPKRVWWRAPAWAALMVAVAVALSWPQPDGQNLSARNNAAVQDSGMYLEIYQTISSEEPRALAPMHSLFEEQE